jgi:protein-disulfide isomerase
MSKLKDKVRRSRVVESGSNIYTVLSFVLILIFFGLVYFVFSQPRPVLDLDALENGGHSKGSSSAKVRVVVFSDFQCPFCGKVAPILNDLVEKYPDKIKLTFRHLPLSEIHGNAKTAAMAAECAGLQGKFWEMHDVMFMNQDKLGLENLVSFARDIGVDEKKFSSCIVSGETSGKVDADNYYARSSLGLNSTPTIYINGVKASFNSFEELSQLIVSKIN